MNFTGLIILIAFQILRFIPYEKYIYPSFLIGAIIPDIDSIAVLITSFFLSIEKSESIFYQTFTHNIFAVIIIYLLFAIACEIKNKKSIKVIGRGLSLGMIVHILIDILLSINTVSIIWPLSLKSINIWNFYNIPDNILRILISIEFFFFRWYAWYLININIKQSNFNFWYFTYLNKWKNIGSLIFILNLILAIINISYFKIIFYCFFIPSILIAIWATYLSAQSLNKITSK